MRFIGQFLLSLQNKQLILLLGIQHPYVFLEKKCSFYYFFKTSWMALFLGIPSMALNVLVPWR